MTPAKDFQNILIFNPAFLGDALLTTPLIRAVRKLFPKARITFCVRPEHAELFRGVDILDVVISFHKRDAEKGVSGVFAFASRIGAMNFDLVINLHKSIRSSTLFALVRKPFVVGFHSAVLSSFFNKRVERPLELHEALRNLTTLSALCPDFTLVEAQKLGGELTCFIDKDILHKARYYYGAVTGKKKIIGVAPGSVWATKRWPAEYFAEAAEALYENGFAIALFGGPGDEEATETFKRIYKYDCYDFAMKTSLRELPAFLASIDLLIVNDSGAMHVAVAAGTPCVAIFGPTVKSLGFFPYDDKSVVVENDALLCRPCGKHGGDACPRGHFKCMRDVPPCRVAAAAVNLLSAGK